MVSTKCHTNVTQKCHSLIVHTDLTRSLLVYLKYVNSFEKDENVLKKAQMDSER